MKVAPPFTPTPRVVCLWCHKLTTLLQATGVPGHMPPHHLYTPPHKPPQEPPQSATQRARAHLHRHSHRRGDRCSLPFVLHSRDAGMIPIPYNPEEYIRRWLFRAPLSWADPQVCNTKSEGAPPQAPPQARRPLLPLLLLVLLPARAPPQARQQLLLLLLLAARRWPRPAIGFRV